MPLGPRNLSPFPSLMGAPAFKKENAAFIKPGWSYREVVRVDGAQDSAFDHKRTRFVFFVYVKVITCI